jgi:hypothetical protein
MMQRSRTLATLAAIAAAAAPAAAAASTTTSHAKVWKNKANTVFCGVKIHIPGKPATLVLCQAKGIPGPKGGIGDPAVQIGKNGRPHRVRISQCSWNSCSRVKTLKTGARWSSLGVSCTVVRKLVTCQNKSRHGFAIGNGRYRSF